MEHHKQIMEYFKKRGVSAIFLFRKNLLRRMISVLASSYDKDAKPLNVTHKSHVHSPVEVSLLLYVHIVLYEQKCKESKEKQKSRAKFLREYCKTEIMILDLLRFRYSPSIIHT